MDVLLPEDGGENFMDKKRDKGHAGEKQPFGEEELSRLKGSREERKLSDSNLKGEADNKGDKKHPVSVLEDMDEASS